MARARFGLFVIFCSFWVHSLQVCNMVIEFCIIRSGYAQATHQQMTQTCLSHNTWISQYWEFKTIRNNSGCDALRQVMRCPSPPDGMPLAEKLTNPWQNAQLMITKSQTSVKLIHILLEKNEFDKYIILEVFISPEGPEADPNWDIMFNSTHLGCRNIFGQNSKIILHVILEEIQTAS